MNFSLLPAHIPEGIFAHLALGYTLVFPALFFVLLFEPQHILGRGAGRVG